MKGIDTNILIRFLTGDDELQAKIVYNICKKAESEKKELFVPLLVILELIWVLESVYEISRTEILDSISELILMPILKFEHQSALQQFTRSAQDNSYDLSDLLIANAAKAQGCETVITFDKKSSKSNLFELAK
ncbi:tRNA(fMet)-specific endonuclease VapC [bacterium BMS3Bbin14]|nr:tRNA(fMet)-specific endonuclease VapC [bacterium BMS3Abin13]GBE53706.1 tRNA(fMet)-specific endonuclease VapC [bacterium BMS3Bbin14]HDL98622.1 PIN domain-containing protein [Desulfobacteraceae bacterium]HDO29914.1 PIN domain-containing protein [Desulfobacteraceae bacterium]